LIEAKCFKVALRAADFPYADSFGQWLDEAELLCSVVRLMQLLTVQHGTKKKAAHRFYYTVSYLQACLLSLF